MKKAGVLLAFCFLCLKAYSQLITVAEVRALYPRCNKEKEVCEQLFAKLSEAHIENNSLLNAYYGAVAANLANHAKEPGQKIKLFNLGRRLLENAVLSDSLSIEIRFLRFTIQANCPESLHYNKSMPADKLFIMNFLETGSHSSLRKNITSYILASKNFSKEERERIRMIGTGQTVD